MKSKKLSDSIQALGDFPYEISIGIIVKNEAKDLLRLLKSLKKLRESIPCQVIITDTGSTDGTIEIAKEYADVYLEFEWCNDFAAARNTGVEVAQGRWFSYFDADEFLDYDCDDLIDFFRTKNHNDFTVLEIERVDYSNTSFTRAQSIKLHRFVNFSKGKLFFKDKIHEYIVPHGGMVHATTTKIHHTGYVGVNLPKKLNRNENPLYEQIEENPNNVRAFLHLGVGKMTNEDRIQVFEECLSRIEDIKNPPDKLYIMILELLSRIYYSKAYHEKQLNLVKDYIDSTDENYLPHMEIIYFMAKAMIRVGDLEAAIKYFERYQAMYEFLEENTDNIFNVLPYLNTNRKTVYELSFFTLSGCYFSIGEKEKSYAIIEESKLVNRLENDKPIYLSAYLESMYKMKRYDKMREAYDMFSGHENQHKLSIAILEPYFKPVAYTNATKDFAVEFCKDITDSYVALNVIRNKNFKIDDLDSSVIELIKEDKLTYKSTYFYDLLYYTLKTGEDVFELIENCSSAMIFDYIRAVYVSYGDYPVIVIDYLKKLDLDVITSQKQIQFVRNLSYLYLANLTNIHDSIHVENQDVYYVLDVYIKLSEKIMSAVYNLDKIEEYMDLIPNSHSLALCLIKAYEYKNSNQLEYIRMIKKALNYDESMFKCISMLIEEVKVQSQREEDDKNEFSALANQVKSQIKLLINSGDLITAKAFLEEYVKINPNDTELADLDKKINS